MAQAELTMPCALNNIKLGSQELVNIEHKG